MVRFVFASLIIFFSSNAFSQNRWFRDFNTAQSYALAEGKLIILDFWASWCGPCRSMDFQLWGSEEFADISNNVVLFKVDVDIHPELTFRYKAQSIPKVVIVDATGDVLVERVGFSGASDYLDLFSKMPADVSKLSEALGPIVDKDSRDLTNYEVAIAYQELGRENDTYPWQDVFLDQSNSYFKKVKGKDGNIELSDLADLQQILNMAYKGRTKQAQKKLAKLDQEYMDARAIELLDFIQAYCFKLDGDNDNFLKKKQKIKNDVYLSQLDS